VCVCVCFLFLWFDSSVNESHLQNTPISFYALLRERWMVVLVSIWMEERNIFVMKVYEECYLREKDGVGEMLSAW